MKISLKATNEREKKHNKNDKEKIPKKNFSIPLSKAKSSPPATLHGKTQGFVLRLPPHNIAHATFMQPFQCDLQPELQETHRTTHTGARILAKHIGGTNRVRNDRSRNRRTHEVPFIVACSHFTRKNTRFRAPASSPKHSPCNIAICNQSCKKRIELRTQKQEFLQNT